MNIYQFKLFRSGPVLGALLLLTATCIFGQGSSGKKGGDPDAQPKKTQEERTAVANEAFARLRALHNEMVALADLVTPDAKAVGAAASETRKRAIQLRANLTNLPEAAKTDKDEKTAPPTTARDSLLRLCDLIKNFATNINKMATDKTAGARARGDLDLIIDFSEHVAAEFGPKDPVTN